MSWNEASTKRLLSKLVNERFVPPMEKANAKFKDSQNYLTHNYKGPNGRKHYACIHLPITEFINHFDTWYDGGWGISPFDGNKTIKRRFLDVGCGVGQKVWLFSELAPSYWGSHGLEYDSEMVSLASGLVGENCSIHQGDAVTWKDYGNYDLIYFYCPLSEREGQMKLELNVMRRAKVGAVVWCVYNPAAFGDPKMVKAMGWEQHHDHRWMFRKVRQP